jgi:hypothetical protein
MSTIQKQKPRKTREQVKEEFKNAIKRTYGVFVRELAEAIRDENPLWIGRENLESNVKDEIRELVYSDCEELGLNQNSVASYIPSWLEKERNRQRTLRAWETRNAAKLEASIKKYAELKNIELPEPPQPKEPEPISEEKLHDLGLGSYGESHKSVHRVRNEIHEGIRLLFKALCDDKDLPNDQDDLIVDYIKPTREYRLGLAMEFDQAQRTNMHNKLHFVITAAEDMIEQIDKADNK